MWFSFGQLRSRCAPMVDSTFDALGARREHSVCSPVSRGISATAIALATAFMAMCAWWFGLREPPVVRVTPPLGSLLLRVGGRLPPLRAEGWINGGPRRVRDQLGKIVVVDIWNDLCGVCRQATPQLRNVAANYDDNADVVFIGLTARTKDQAEQFIREAGIEWTNGYGVEALEPIGPTIIVLGRDGRIVWDDERSRLRHSIGSLAHDLNAAITKAATTKVIEQPPVAAVSPSRLADHGAARSGG